ncbi:uncharacterized protein [Leptinotarsa decemlineata]|uniref:uncharacterized protein n=1 Tax=Leptinotarsa decemlineata TaxID=7539 RepID=UPI003D306023
MKTAILITAMGDETFELMVDLCSPEKPENKSYEDLVKLVVNHLQPTPSEIAERYKFRQRKQEPSESIACYVAVLKKLSKNCNFGTNLETELRDQVVFGLKNDIIRQRLFQETNLTYVKAYDLAINLEAAEINSGMICTNNSVCRIDTSRSSADVSKEFKRDRPPSFREDRAHRGGSNKCQHCGKRNHSSAVCFFKEAICRLCQKRGHISTVCKKKGNKLVLERQTKCNKLSIDKNSDDSDLYELNFYNITQVDEKPIKVVLLINKKTIAMECDTGSPISAISNKFYTENFKNVPLLSSNLNLKSYIGNKLITVGYIKVEASYDGVTGELKLFVIKNGGPPIIGRKWIKNFNISIDNLLKSHRINHMNVIEDIPKILQHKFPEVFREGLGKFNKGKAQLHLKENTTPIFCKTRSLALSLREKVESELNKLVSSGILTPIEYSNWATPIVPVLKKLGK